MKKKMLSALLAALMLLTLAACGNRGSIPGDNPPEFEDIPNQEIDPEWEAEQEQKYEMEQYGLDLSMYDDHGEWSYDRMWVHKTEESWDAVKGYYGYIDREGNLIDEWHEEKTNDNSFRNEEFLSYELETAPWLVPGDFQGEYAVILCGGYRASQAYLEIIDAQGSSIARFVPDFTTYSYNTNEGMLKDFARKLSNDVLFWDRDWDEVAMSWIENGQYHERAIDTAHLISAFEIKEKINGYYPHWDYFDGTEPKSYFGLIAEDGDHVFHGEMDYEVKKLVPSAEAETVSVYFIGADKREYVVQMDFDGNWLADPTLAS